MDVPHDNPLYSVGLSNGLGMTGTWTAIMFRLASVQCGFWVFLGCSQAWFSSVSTHHRFVFHPLGWALFSLAFFTRLPINMNFCTRHPIIIYFTHHGLVTWLHINKQSGQQGQYLNEMMCSAYRLAYYSPRATQMGKLLD